MPEFEEREAAIFCGYTWREWRELAREERAAGIAHYRCHNLIEAHSSDAVNAHIESKVHTR